MYKISQDCSQGRLAGTFPPLAILPWVSQPLQAHGSLLCPLSSRVLVPPTAGALMVGVPKIAMELGWAKLCV